MRETGVVRFRFSGDKATVDSYIGEARTQLGIMKDRMAAFGMSQLVHSRTLPDGTRITVGSLEGQDVIQIDAPPRAPAQALPSAAQGALAAPTEPTVYSIVVGTDENWIVDIDGAYAGGNGRWQFDRNTLDQPAAYSSGARRVTARGGRYATLTALSFVPDGFPDNAVSSVRDTALFEACIPTIRKTSAPPAGLLGPDLSLYYRQLYDDAHWPVLHKLFMNFMGLVKLPPELHGQLNTYLPVRLYPLHYYLDTDGDVVVVFGMKQVAGQPTPVVTGDYATDGQVYVTYEYVDGTSNTVEVRSPLNTVLAKCKARDLPLVMRAPQSAFGAATLPFSLGRDVTLEDVPLGSSVNITVFGDTISLTIPASLDLEAQFSFDVTSSGYLVTFELIGRVDTDAGRFTGILRPRAAVPTGSIFMTAGETSVSLHSVANLGYSSIAQPPSTLQYYSTYAFKVPLDFLTFVDVKHLVSTRPWFTPPVSVPKKVPILGDGGREIGLSGLQIIGPGYHDAHQTGKRYYLDGASSPLAPFKMLLTSEYWNYISRLPVPQYLFDSYLLSFVECVFGFAPDGTLQVLSTLPGALGASYFTSDNIMTGVSYPLTYVGHHKGVDVPLATYSGTYGPGGTTFRVAYDTAIALLTGVPIVESNRSVPGVPVAYPDAHIGVLFPLNYGPVSGHMNYSFYYKGVRVSGPDTITYGVLPGAGVSSTLFAQYGFSVGSDGIGTIAAEDHRHVASPVAEYPQFRVNSQSSIPVPLETPEYPLSGAGTRTGGLVVTCYLRNAQGTSAGVCMIQRAFTADIFASAYLTNPFGADDMGQLRSIIYWFLNTASQPWASEMEEDPAARVSFPAMITAAEAAMAYYDAHSADGTLDKAVFKDLIRDIARNGRTVLVNNFASPALIDFITSHSQTLVLLPYSPALPAAA